MLIIEFLSNNHLSPCPYQCSCYLLLLMLLVTTPTAAQDLNNYFKSILTDSSTPCPVDDLMFTSPLKRNAFALIFVNPIPVVFLDVSNPIPLSFIIRDKDS